MEFLTQPVCVPMWQWGLLILSIASFALGAVLRRLGR